ncbi:MAG TPA: hypothetical protein DCE78_06220 [Bacteroidetes bacterium]|nr:hypothetical protein [Bacteroidota bacterium]
MLEYKGYHGKVEFDEKEGIYHGEVLNIRDVVTFQSKTEDEIQKAFEESVDDYLEFIQESDVNSAREEIKKGDYIDQENLFTEFRSKYSKL